MKPSKNENEVASTVKATAKYAFVAPGAIGKGRGRGFKSICSLGVSGPDIPFSPSTDQVMQYNQSVETSAVAKGRGRGLRSMCSLEVSGMGPTNKNSLVLEKEHMQTNIPSFSSTADVMKYIQKNSMSALEKGRLQELRSMRSLEECENEVRSFHQNTHYTSQSISRPSNNRSSDFTMPSDEQVMRSTQKVETSTLGKGRGRELRSMCSFEESENEERAFHQNAHYASQSMSRPSKSTRLDSTVFAAQGLRTKNINSLVHEKENMQIDSPFSPSIDQVMQSTQTVETGSCTTGNVKKVRGSNKCKEVASLEVGEKLKVIFYNNRTVGKNSNLFSRHLGKIVRDRNICPLGVSSWDRINEEKLNHMWAAVTDKFESDDMDIHRNHILGWMKELWNKWREKLHAKYVKGKPIQEALKNVPKGVDKKQWEWLVKEHFATESFQARSNRNAANRTKLKMLHHIGSEPIREIIYQKAQIKELVQSEPSLPTIEIVEKCFGPQNCSHVFGLGGGVKAKDLKGGTSSKTELLAKLRATEKENQSLKDRLSNFDNEMKEVRQLKELLLAQVQENDYPDP